jgi:ribosomal protein S18 acetylase RimI-like enzyme
MPGAFTRPVDRQNDLDELLGLDFAARSDKAFQVLAGEGASLMLTPEELASPVEKCFPLTLDADPWTEGWVIEEGGRVRGFMACGYNQWNKRLVIWHFYVDRAERRKGFGRQLMDCALSAGRQWGARTAWAETSNVNYPGVIAYQRLGFKLCGFDATLYQGTVNEGEFGLFLARYL